MLLSPDLPPQNVVMAGWTGGPTVSICCLTYNQERYIRDALDGFLRQKTSFPFEILVHDDASTDGTADIVRAYAEAYPALFVTVLQAENQLSQGRQPAAILFSLAQGALMALCEGDDYWTDPEKLERQYLEMQSNPHADMCTHAAVTDRVGFTALDLKDDKTLVTVREVVSKNFVIPTASMVVRRESALKYVEFANDRPHLPFGDLYLRFFSVLRGDGIHINRYMCFNRVLASGSWSERRSLDVDFRLDSRSRKILSFSELNTLSRGQFSDIFRDETYRELRFAAVDKQVPLLVRARFLFAHRHLLPASWNLRLTALLLLR